MIAPRFVEGTVPAQKLTVVGHTWNIWAIPANFNYFVDTALEPSVTAGSEEKTATKSAHSRRRYVGDAAPINVSAHSYTFLYDPGRKVGNALPGYSFILDDGIEKRQFTTDAPVASLYGYLLADLKNTTSLYTQGARYTLVPEAGGGD